MNNKLEVNIRLFENVEGMPHPVASVLYTTPNGRHKVAFEEPPNIDKLPDSDTAWLLRAKKILATAIKIVEMQAEEYKDD